MDKENEVYIPNGVLFTNKKSKILSFAEKWVYLEIIILNEISQTQKDRYCIFSQYVESKGEYRKVEGRV